MRDLSTEELSLMIQEMNRINSDRDEDDDDDMTLEEFKQRQEEGW